MSHRRNHRGQAAPPAGGRARPPRRRGRRPPAILVVEDNDPIRTGWVLLLERHGYRVSAAADGEEALRLLEGGPRPDLILLDFLLPDVDGGRILEYLRGGPLADVPVILATGTALDPKWAADLGATGYLQKPVDDAALLAEVRRCLRLS